MDTHPPLFFLPVPMYLYTSAQTSAAAKWPLPQALLGLPLESPIMLLALFPSFYPGGALNMIHLREIAGSKIGRCTRKNCIL